MILRWQCNRESDWKNWAASFDPIRHRLLQSRWRHAPLIRPALKAEGKREGPNIPLPKGEGRVRGKKSILSRSPNHIRGKKTSSPLTLPFPFERGMLDSSYPAAQ